MYVLFCFPPQCQHNAGDYSFVCGDHTHEYLHKKCKYKFCEIHSSTKKHTERFSLELLLAEMCFADYLEQKERKFVTIIVTYIVLT